MIRLAVLLAAAVALAAPAAARARSAIVDEAGAPDARAQAWVDESLMPSPDVTIVLHRQACPGTPAQSCTWRGGHEVYLAPGAGRGAFYHELGHQAEYASTDLLRGRFLQIIGRAGGAFVSSPNSPHEQLAEAYRACSLWRALARPVRLGYAYVAWPRRHRLVCAAIRREAARDGWTAPPTNRSGEDHP